MSVKSQTTLFVCLSLATSVRFVARGQVAVDSHRPGSSFASTVEQAPPVPSFIVSRVDDSRLVRLQGNTHPLARAEFDRGPVDPQLPMERMILVLKRSPEQEAALESFMARQLDPKSPDFHHWLSPVKFGEIYGVSDPDISAVTNWLQNHGFFIDHVAKGRTFIEFSGSASAVEEAFHTEIHRYDVRGVEHVANNSDPSIPEALSPVVAGILSLHNFFTTPLHRYVGSFRQLKNHKWEPENKDVLKPMFGVVDSQGEQLELVAPYDFATIYNVLPLWNAGIDGTGQSIAIAGRSDINLSDVATFRSAFGLPANAPTVIVNGVDPGEPSVEDRVENTLDVEWAAAVAQGATIKFVTTASTKATDGAVQSALYIIDNNLAPILSFSYGECEYSLGTAGNAAMNTMWQEGAAAGITEFVASGDQGAASCDVGQAPYLPQNGLAVSGTSSTPYDVAVGGTDFQWLNLTGTYWNSTNNSTNLSTAIGYIPEVPWNGTCASSDILQYLELTAAGLDAEHACNTIWTEFQYGFFLYSPSLISATGATGGASACVTLSGNTGTVADCAGGYSKPAWQTGAGVPSDGKRDVPDVSLFASAGELHSAYLFCDSEVGPCDFTVSSDAIAQGIGGTSVASPAMAGIMALVLQKTGGAAQGLANPAFYQLASQENLGGCNSSTVTSGNACVFYDITTDNNRVPCATGSPNCMTETAGDAIGILSGYDATTGYDVATGLGSVNVNNLVAVWNTAFTSSTVLSANPTSINPGQSTMLSATVSGGTPTGYVGTPPAVTGTVTFKDGTTAVGNCTLSGGTCATSVNASSFQSGGNSVTATFGGSGTYPSSTSSIVIVTVTGSPTLITPSVTVTPPSSSITTAQGMSVTVAVSGGTGNPIPTGSVTLSSGSYASAPTTLSAGSTMINVPAGQLAAGNDTLTATYTPDSSSSSIYNSAIGSAPVTVVQAIGSCATSNPNPNPNPESFAAPGDFNGDCKSDILWRNTSTEQVYLWLMNGVTLGSSGSPGSPTSDWVIQGAGDFNGDGKADILWRNTTTGEVYLWLMNGAAMSSSGSLGYVSSNWTIQGIGDFNGDGKADILWRNSTTGQVYIWLMNGTTMTGGGSVNYVSSDWSIQGVGDFNGDGKADILWRNSTTGQVYIWLMNGTTISGGGSVNYVSSNWSIQGVGDFNGDGTSDILWRDSTTGQVYVWLMNGATISGGGSVNYVSSDWSIQGVGDYDGSGRAGILWRNSTTEQVYIWLLNGATITSTGSPGAPSSDWQIAP